MSNAMTSTYVSYLQYASNFAKAEKRVASEATVARDAKYYQDNIGKVKTVDDFLNNYRLFSYAMKSYGLQDMTYAKGFMRKVLLSDITDSTSFANKLSDKRYQDFAKAFSFNSDGTVTNNATMLDEEQLTDITKRYAAKYPNADKAWNSTVYEVNLYDEANAVFRVTSVENIIADESRRTLVLQAFALDPETTSDDALRSALTSDLSDPNSYANTIGDARFVALAGAFNFGSDGLVKDGYLPQNAEQVSTMMSQYRASPESTYFKLKLGDVATVDDLVNDDRMRNYVLTAYGLSTDTTTTALRDILTSDLTDPNSYANSTGDTRITALAEAFNFDTDGSIKSGYDVQSADKTEAMARLYFKETDTTADADVDFYETYRGNIQSVDDLLNSDRITSYVLTAYGLDPNYTSAAAIRATLTSDLSDPNSYANTIGDARFVALAQAFNFDADGNVKAGYDAQSTTQQAATTAAYLDAKDTSNDTSSTDVTLTMTLYQQVVPSITNVEEFIDYPGVPSFVVRAYGLEADNLSSDTLRQILTSDLNDPDSFANQSGDSRYIALAAAYNFDTTGAVKAGYEAQSSGEMATAMLAYMAATTTNDITNSIDVSSATSAFKSAVAKMTSVDDLINNPQAMDYIYTAYGLNTAEISNATLRLVLTSDLSDPDSFVNMMGDEKLSALAADFNIDASGKVVTHRVAQTSKNIETTTAEYATVLGDSASAKAKAETETTYYTETIAKVTSLNQLMADTRLTDYIKTAFKLDANLSNDKLRAVLTSDLSNEQSVAAKLGGHYIEAARAFNFTTSGTIGRETGQTPQSAKAVQATYDLYIRQTMETEAGNESEGTRLALYFQRKASSIDSAYTILADKALYEVVRTTLNIPTTAAQAEITVQAAQINKLLKIDDLKDTDFLSKFLAKFATLYDLNNASSTDTTGISTLITPLSATATGNTATIIGLGDALLSSAMSARRSY